MCTRFVLLTRRSQGDIIKEYLTVVSFGTRGSEKKCIKCLVRKRTVGELIRNFKVLMSGSDYMRYEI